MENPVPSALLPDFTDAVPAMKKMLGDEITPLDRLGEAEQLLALGFPLAACMTARVSLERWLQAEAKRRQLCKGIDGIHAYAATFRKLNHIDESAFQSIRSIGRELNKAAHGKELPAARTEAILADLRKLFSLSDSSHQEAA